MFVIYRIPLLITYYDKWGTDWKSTIRELQQDLLGVVTPDMDFTGWLQDLHNKNVLFGSYLKSLGPLIFKV